MHRTAHSHPNAAMLVHSLNYGPVTAGGVGSLCGLPNNREKQENQHVTPVSAGSPNDLTDFTLFSICVGFAWLLKTDGLSGLQPFSDQTPHTTAVPVLF